MYIASFVVIIVIYLLSGLGAAGGVPREGVASFESSEGPDCANAAGKHPLQATHHTKIACSTYFVHGMRRGDAVGSVFMY